MKFYETVEVTLPFEISESELKNIALNYKKDLEENNLKDNFDNFDFYYDDIENNEYFYVFLFNHNLDFDIKNFDIKNIYLAIKKYM